MPHMPCSTSFRPLLSATLGVALLLGGGCTSRRGPVQVRNAPADDASPAELRGEVNPNATNAGTVGPIVEPWTFEGRTGRILITSGHRVHTTIAEQNTLLALAPFLDALVERYRTALGDLPAPDRPMDTFLFAERGEWQNYTREIMKERAALYLNLGRGGYSVRGTAVLFDIDETGYRDTFSIIAHEGWHQYTQVVFQHALPTWLEEGIATWMEGRVERGDGAVVFDGLANRARLEMLSNALNTGRLIKLTELIERVPQQFLQEGDRHQTRLLTYYAQVWALVNFLYEGENGLYREALERVLQDAADGRIVSTILTSPYIAGQQQRRTMATSVLGPGVILAYFNRDLAEFDEQFNAYIVELVKRRGTPLHRYVDEVEVRNAPRPE